jgi:hypothetical protein
MLIARFWRDTVGEQQYAQTSKLLAPAYPKTEATPAIF